MSTATPENDDPGDPSQEDLDDLGTLGDDDADGDGGGEGGTGDAPKLPTQEEWDKARRKIARLEGKVRGKSGAGTSTDRAMLDQLNGGKTKDDTDDKGSDETERWKGIAIQNAASAQITAAGFSGTAKQAARLARLIQTEGIQPNKDGSFDLEDEIGELKDEYPQLFADKAPAGRPPRVRTAPSSGTPAADPTQKATNALLRSAGYR